MSNPTSKQLETREQTIERIAKDACESLYFSVVPEREILAKALAEAMDAERSRIVDQAISAQCKYCSGTIDDVSPEPDFYAGHQYISNYGEVDNQYIHGDKWGEHHACECSTELRALKLIEGED